MWEYNYTDELYHHGVKGMKWGHRKTQKRTLPGSDRRAAKKQLRYDRKNNDLIRKQNWKQAKEKKKYDASYKKSRDYKAVKKDHNYYLAERRTLTARDRDKLYENVKNGEEYTKAYLKAQLKSTGKRTVRDIAIRGITTAGLFAGVAYVAKINSAANSPIPRLPASDIIEIKNAVINTI